MAFVYPWAQMYIDMVEAIPVVRALSSQTYYFWVLVTSKKTILITGILTDYSTQSDELAKLLQIILFCTDIQT